MSDRIAVFNDGRIEQIGTPAEVYERPATEFVAGFVGISNIARARRARASPCARRRSACCVGAGPTAAHGERARPRGRLRRHVHALRRRARRAASVWSSCARTSRSAPRGARARGRSAARLAAGTRTRSQTTEQEEPQEDTMTQAHVAPWHSLARGARVRGVAASAGRAALLPKAIGKGEGTLNMIAWEGYTQTPVGEAVREADRLQGQREVRRLLGRDGHADALGGGGQYDMVSASGDASLRLIYGGDVAAGRTSKLIPDYKNFIQGVPVAAEQHGRRQALRHLAAVGPEHAALQHEEGEAGADELVRDLRARSTRARSRSPTTRSRSPTRRCTCRRRSRRSGSRIPYELNEKQFDAAVDLLKKQRR